MKQRIIHQLLLCTSGILFLLSLFLLGRHLLEYRQGAAIYRSAQELAGITPSSNPISQLHSEESSVPITDSASNSQRPSSSQEIPDSTASSNANLSIDLTTLRQVNPDVLGWISIPETKVSYPLLQGTDNQFYLNHAWDKTNNSVGSIYLEAQCNPDFSDFNTLIYGHRMKDSSMFGSLKHYQDQDYLDAHPQIIITDDTGTKRYQIYSAFEAEIDASVYLIGTLSKTEKQAIIDYTLEKNVLASEITPTTEDQLITLCTCTNHGYESQWVVLGVLKPD